MDIINVLSYVVLYLALGIATTVFLFFWLDWVHEDPPADWKEYLLFFTFVLAWPIAIISSFVAIVSVGFVDIHDDAVMNNKLPPAMYDDDEDEAWSD